MTTLLHHIQPWMQKSIAESKARMERHMQRKIAEVNQRLDAFELRVLAQPAPPVDVSTLQASVDSLRADIDTILGERVPESVEPAEDTVLAALFPTPDIPRSSLRESAKRRGVDQRMRREQERKSAERWRPRGEPHLLRRRHTRSEHSR